MDVAFYVHCLEPKNHHTANIAATTTTKRNGVERTEGFFGGEGGQGVPVKFRNIYIWWLNEVGARVAYFHRDTHAHPPIACETTVIL